MKNYLQKLWLLFFTFAKIAALVVGGGLAMLPVIEETFVREKKLLNREEVLDMVAFTQSIPGIIAVNSAVFVGWKAAGLPGALVASLGAVLPSFLVILLIAVFFPHLDPQQPVLLGVFAGVRAAVTGMVAVTAINMAKNTVKSIPDGMAALAVLVLVLWGINPVWLILLSIPYGILLTIKLKKHTPEPDGAEK